jgi:hypothetical protein
MSKAFEGRIQPQNPQYNGISKKKNNTLLEHARSLMLKIKLPKNMWFEIINFAIHLFNKSLTRLNLGLNPYEKNSSTKPNWNHLCTFRCRTFVHIDKVNRTGQLDSKLMEHIHLGYNLETKRL